MRAMILAAGRGERLRPITNSIPKALVAVHGVSLLELHLQRLAAAGISDVVINLGWRGDQIVDRIGGGDRFGLNVSYSPEGDAVLETGGGIHRALPMLGSEAFWVINADVYTDFRLRPLALADHVNAHLVLVPQAAHRSVGDFDCRAGRVSNGRKPQYTFSGIACYRPEFFAGLQPGRFSVVPLLRAAADRGQISGELYEGLWSDVGTPERLAELNSEAQDG